MDYRPPSQPRPLFLTFYLLVAFAGGVMVERYHLLPGGPPQAPSEVGATFDIFWEAWRLVDEHYVDRQAIKPLNMTRGAIQGMLASLGDYGHTGYVTPEQLKQKITALEGHMEGIGARLNFDKNVTTVFNTLPNSPAREAGLKAGDVLLQVDHTPVANLSPSEIFKRVSGPAGTTVHLEVLHSGQNKPVDLDIRRAKVDVAEATWHMLPDLLIAHLAIQQFGKTVDRELDQALREAQEQGAKGLILDVRGNLGGFKDKAVVVTSAFLKEGNVFLEKNAQGEVTAVPVKPGDKATDLPVAVLIDNNTASSAEIFAGALQDHHRGKLIGTKTFGTGTVLEPFPLRDGSAVFLAVTLWLTPNGRQIWHKGIEPDIEVKLPEDAQILLPELETNLTAAELAKSKDTQLLKAIEVLKGQFKK